MRFAREVVSWVVVIALLVLILIAVSAHRVNGQTCPNGNCPSDGWRSVLVPAKSAHPAVVKVHNTLGNERSGGSGVLIATNEKTGTVLTCGHLFREGRGKIVVVFPDGMAYSAKPIKISSGVPDLAVLRIRRPSCRSVVVRVAPLRPGEAVVCWGYPYGGPLRRMASRVLKPLLEHGRHLVVAGNASQGDSGGPVFDAQGRLIGIIWGTGHGQIMAASPEAIREFLQQSPQDGRQQIAPGLALGPKDKPPAPIDNGPTPAELPVSSRPPAAALGARLAEIQRQNAEVQRRLAELEKRPQPIRGPPGPPGPQGPAGNTTEASVDYDLVVRRLVSELRKDPGAFRGPPGKDASVDDMQAFVDSRPLRVRLYDTDGQIIDETTVSLGGELRLQLYERENATTTR